LVETTQIAPTILDLLGLDPSALDASQDRGNPGAARHRPLTDRPWPWRVYAPVTAPVGRAGRAAG
jgi:hypothetical protein